MKPTPIFKDQKGWREKNPYQEPPEFLKHTKWHLFEESITYHEFPDAPNVKPGEVVMAYLQWQSKPKEDNFEWEGDRDWQTLPIEDNTEVDMEDYTGFDDFTDHVSWGFITRQIWVAANQSNQEHQGLYLTSDKGVTAHVNMNPNADKETVDAVKRMIDLAHNMPSKAHQEGKEEQSKLSEIAEKLKSGANWKKQQPTFQHQAKAEVSEDENRIAIDLLKTTTGWTAVKTKNGGKVHPVFLQDKVVEAMEQYATLKASSLQQENDKLREALNIMICGYYDGLSEESLLECEAILKSVTS